VGGTPTQRFIISTVDFRIWKRYERRLSQSASEIKQRRTMNECSASAA
jgi:hypothetical protein